MLPSDLVWGKFEYDGVKANLYKVVIHPKPAPQYIYDIGSPSTPLMSIPSGRPEEAEIKVGSSHGFVAFLEDQEFVKALMQKSLELRGRDETIDKAYVYSYGPSIDRWYKDYMEYTIRIAFYTADPRAKFWQNLEEKIEECV